MNYGKRIASLYMLENPIHYKKCYCFDLIIRKMVQGHAHGLALDCIIMKLTEKKKNGVIIIMLSGWKRAPIINESEYKPPSYRKF